MPAHQPLRSTLSSEAGGDQCAPVITLIGYLQDEKASSWLRKNIHTRIFHIDVSDHDHINHRGPVDRLDFIADDSVDLIYASHVLEHFGRQEVEKVLTKWRRVLRPDGILRLAIPDLRHLHHKRCSSG